jgi:hypothetical protein
MTRCCTRGPATTFAILCVASAVAVAALHESARRARLLSGSSDSGLLYGVVVVVLFCYRAAATSAFTTLGLVVNASVGRDQVGHQRTTHSLVCTALSSPPLTSLSCSRVCASCSGGPSTGS